MVSSPSPSRYWSSTVRPRTRLRPRSMRSGAAPFFQLRPALVDPLLDGFVVALFGPPCWALPTPAQAVSQDVPHVRRVVVHAGDPLDHLSHALQGPHIVGIAVGFGTFGQFGLDLVKLLAIHLRQPSRSSSAT